MWFLTFLVAALTFAPSFVEAVEYRLQVINVTEEAFGFYMDQAKGSPNGSWVRLESAADRGEVPWGVILADRFLKKATPALQRAFEAVPTKAEAVEGGTSWLEFRWEGDPGKRAVWVVEAGGFSPLHEVRYVGLKGTGPGGYWIPLNAPLSAVRLRAVAFPTQFVLLWNGRTSLWERWISRYLDLGDGIGALVGVDTNPTFPDRVFLVIDQPPAPAVFKAALAWRKRPQAGSSQFDAPSDDRDR